jgi:hypothetical protein
MCATKAHQQRLEAKRKESKESLVSRPSAHDTTFAGVVAEPKKGGVLVR